MNHSNAIDTNGGQPLFWNIYTLCHRV